MTWFAETNLENSPLVLSGGRTGNCRSIGRTTEPRFFANRAVVVGRGERGVVEDERTGDGVTRSFDASQPIGDILSITEDGVEQTFDGTDPRWEIDVDQQRFVLVTGKGATPSGDTIRFGYVSAEAMVVTADNAAAITDIGFPIARRYEDDTIDDVGLARTLATARLDRHDQRFEEFIAETIPGAVKRLRPGVAPTFNFPRYGLSSVRLLVESVSERLGPGGGVFHPVVLSIRGTAQDYQGDSGDDWRAATAYRPPAPRPAVPDTADPNQSIISPGNVAVTSAIPLHLGGSVASAVVTADWGTPDGAILDPGIRSRDCLPAGAQLHGPVPASRGAVVRSGCRVSPVGRDYEPGHRVISQHRHHHSGGRERRPAWYLAPAA